MIRKSLIVICLCLIFDIAHTQIPGFFMSKGAKKIEIPFERQDNFIIVKVLFEGLFPLRFIIDTGAEHTILTKKEITNLLRVTYDREISIMGTDMTTEIKAYIARKMRMELTNLTLIRDILVLDDDYFKFAEFTGLDIQGIIGAEAFKGHVLKIDYVKQIITIYDPSVYKESEHRKFQEVPIKIERSKPYINVTSKINKDTTVSLKLLIDTGAALALLLHTYSTPGLVMPPLVIKGNIGVGLGGQIEGFMGRINSLNVGQTQLNNIISHFQELNEASDSIHVNKRNGILGGEILSRFTIIIDFLREKMYVQPNKNLKTAFEYDKSGMVIIAGGASLTTFTVYDILPNSPASETDILRGDEIVSINRIPARFYTLGAVNQKFQGKAGKKIRLGIKRNGKNMIRNLILRPLI